MSGATAKSFLQQISYEENGVSTINETFVEKLQHFRFTCNKRAKISAITQIADKLAITIFIPSLDETEIVNSTSLTIETFQEELVNHFLS